MNAITFAGVTVEMNGALILDGVSLDVAAGETLVVVGPSGAGKTTALRMLTGFVAPTFGSVRVGTTVVSQNGRILVPPEARRLAMVFQDLALWPHLTVAGNLAFALSARGIDRATMEERIGRMLARVGLSSAAGRYPGSLSGGERQRVAIARALVIEPYAVLLDEPLANLDVLLKRELRALFAELLRERRLTTIYVTHDPREAAALADRIAVLENGRIVQTATVSELVAAPATPFATVVAEELRFGASASF